MSKELNKNVDTNIEVQDENEMELEIIELEDKIAPRNWSIYALIS